jgi:hypothetical protein
MGPAKLVLQHNANIGSPAFVLHSIIVVSLTFTAYHWATLKPFCYYTISMNYNPPTHLVHLTGFCCITGILKGLKTSRAIIQLPGKFVMKFNFY